MATGYALARGEPAFVNLHTAAGLGNAINAIANARDCRAPLVIVVGQQDRRQIAFEPFLTGRALERLAGEYPVWRQLPEPRPGRAGRDRPRLSRGGGGARPRAGRGADGRLARAGRRARRRGAGAGVAPALGGGVRRSRSSPICWPAPSAPALVVGAPEGEDWDAVVALAERLRCPVWQEPFSRRVGFPQDHPLFAGHLPLAAAAHARVAGPLRRGADRGHERVPGLSVRRAGGAGRARRRESRC